MNRKTHLFSIPVLLLLAVLMTACVGEGKTVTVAGGDDPAVTEEVDQVEPEPMEDDSDNPVETEAVESQTVPDSIGDTTGSDPFEGRLIECGPGFPALAGDGSAFGWDDGTAFSSDDVTAFGIKVTSSSIIFTTTNPELPGDGVFYTGVDFQDPTGPQTGPIEGFALGEGTTFGVSAAIEDGGIVDISAVRAGDNGEILPWTTAATAEIGAGFVTIEIPLSEIPGGIDRIRFTLSDGELCELSSIFEIAYGFNDIFEFSPEVGEVLENNENEAICYKDLCFSLREEVFWEPTGDNAGNVTIGANEFILQVYTSAGGADDVVKVFEDTGWNPVESRGYESFLGIVRGFDLESSDQVYGSLNVLEPTSGDNAKTAVVAATGQSPLSEDEQEGLKSFLLQVIDSLLLELEQ